jgi:hypothetical protein
MKTGVKATATALIGFVVFVVLLFLPAGTFDYWQAWLFITVFAASTWVPAAYLIRTNPAALERRMRAGPLAETRTVPQRPSRRHASTATTPRANTARRPRCSPHSRTRRSPAPTARRPAAPW